MSSIAPLPTLASLLTIDAIRAGDPHVVSGSEQLDRPVRWVHVTELSDVGSLLDGGELILTTGIGLDDDPVGLQRYVEDLAQAGVAGLAIEMGRRFHETPLALVERARSLSLPVIELRNEIRFIDVTQAVHALVLGSQVKRLEVLVSTHSVFTALSVRGASLIEVLDQARSLCGHDVIFVDPSGRVLEVSSDRPVEEALAIWTNMSSRDDGRAVSSESDESIVVPVEAQQRRWGRVVILPDHGTQLDVRARTVAERCAETIALGRLVERDDETLTLQAHGSVFADAVDRDPISTSEFVSRAWALGEDMSSQNLIGICVKISGRPTPVEGRRREAAIRSDAEIVHRAALSANVASLVRSASVDRVEIVVALRSAEVDSGLVSVATAIHESFARSAPLRVDIGVGPMVEGVVELRRSVAEAAQAVDATVGGHRLFHRLGDVRVRGLAQLLQGDPRIETFVEREIGRLVRHDSEQQTDLFAVLKQYLADGGNKSTAAESLAMSRPALYHRLDLIQRILQVDLDEPESRTSLHLAVLAHEVSSDEHQIGDSSPM